MSGPFFELGVEVAQHTDEIEEVKRQVGITHNFFDGWIYNFLENKHFDIKETVAKLHRRTKMEQDELAAIEITPSISEQLRNGIIQIIGYDKDDRVTLFVNTCRDFPKASMREERRKIFDMWMCYACRLRRNNKRCRITMLINQEGASVWSNTDMSFQSNIALRIAKYYPNAVDKMYICNMGKALAAFAKPIFSRLPAAVSERIFILTDADMKAGKLHTLFDDDVLPVPMGGKNDCDNQQHWNRFADEIEANWRNLSAALRAGKGVKEWEMQNIIEEIEEEHKAAAVPVPHKDYTTTGRDGASTIQADSATMHTCYSEDDMDDADLRDVDLSFPTGPSGLSSDPFWALQQKVIETRHEIEKEEDIFRVALLMLCGNERTRLLEDDDELVTHNQHKSFVQSFPPPAQAAVRTVLFVLCVFMAVFLAVATLFYALLIGAWVILLFYGMFMGPFLVYPLGLLLLVFGAQQVQILSRGCGLVRTSFTGRVIHPLCYLGGRGLSLQLAFFAVVLLANLAVFVYYAITLDPVTGVLISFTTSWITCAVIILIFHFFFPIGLREIKYAKGSNPAGDRGNLSLYLFFDITEQEEQSRTRRSAIMISALPCILSLLFGTCFITSNHLFFLVSTPIITILAAATVSYFISDKSRNLNTVLVIVTTWLVALVWLLIVIAGGTIEMNRDWLASLIGNAGILLVLAALCYAAFRLSGKPHFMLVLRLGYLFIICLAIAGVVLAFLQHWALGVMALVLLIHTIAGAQSADHLNLPGLLLMLLVIVVLITSVILLSDGVLNNNYDTPRSINMTNSSTNNNSNNNNPYILRHQNVPICLLNISGFSIVDMALFSEVVYSTGHARVTDMANWFPDWTAEPIISFNHRNFGEIHRFQHTVSNATVLVFRSVDAQLASMVSVTAWMEALALAPLSVVMPSHWSPEIIGFFSFFHKYIDYGWLDGLREVTEYVTQFAAQHRAQQHQLLFLTGHGIGGAASEVVGASAHIPAFSFAAPGLLNNRHKFNLDGDSLRDYTTNVVGTAGSITSLDGQGETAQRLECEGSLNACSSIEFFGYTMVTQCPDGRGHVKPDED